MWRTGVLIFALFLGHAMAEDIQPGSLLVASDKLNDPNFAESVVVIVRLDDDGSLGLVLNRRSEVPLTRLFPDVKSTKSEPIFIGGPVSRNVAQALLRLPAKTAGTRRVIGDVYVTAEKTIIEKSIASGAAPSRFRVYAGYAGWAPGQLEMEIEVGAWTVIRPGVSSIFDDDPETLWHRLSRETQRVVARARSLSATPRTN
jgi:putative transcriptional regulator